MGVAIAGAVTDNTAAKAWSQLQKQYHSQGQPVAKYPEGYPFEYLKQFVEDCKDVVSFSFHIINWRRPI